MGKTLISIAAPASRKFVLGWHRNRCLAAAHRARWIRELEARGRMPIKDATTPAPLDAFTKKAFGPGDKQCAVPARLLRGVTGLEAQAVTPLPPAPPASQPAQEPAGNK